MILQLQKEILSLQGQKNISSSEMANSGLGLIEKAFPFGIFPIGAVHEFISNKATDAAATNGFITSLMGKIVQGGVCLWISNKRTVFPPALKIFGIAPDKIIFIDLNKHKDVLWAIEEALKCEVLAAVVGELTELTFTQSLRLQHAVEQSKVTGFIHRINPRIENTVACISRWKIKSVASVTEDGLPGLGFPRWNVQLIKVRNGKPSSWQIEWANNSFRYLQKQKFALPEIQILKAG